MTPDPRYGWVGGISRALVVATATAIAARRAPRAPVATLLGAAEAELEAAGAVLDPLEEQWFRETETSLPSALGADEFAAAQARGRTLRRPLMSGFLRSAGSPPK